MSDLRITLDSDIKESAELLFKNMGTSLTNAVKMFISQSLNSGGFPFQPHEKTPNTTTIAAFREAEKGQTTVCTLEEFEKEMDTLKNG